ATDACHLPGTRDLLTGICSNPAKPDGAECVDGQICTQTETCQAGVCLPQNPARPVVVNLPVDDLGTIGIWESANDINAAGSVGGASTESDQTLRAWQWTSPGPMVDLEAQLNLGHPSGAVGINDAGTVVGYQTVSGVAYPFRYGAARREDFTTG